MAVGGTAQPQTDLTPEAASPSQTEPPAADLATAASQADAAESADNSEADRVPHHHGRYLASPAVRRVARTYGVNLNDVMGTGPGGRILKEDVQR